MNKAVDATLFSCVSNGNISSLPLLMGIADLLPRMGIMRSIVTINDARLYQIFIFTLLIVNRAFKPILKSERKLLTDNSAILGTALSFSLANYQQGLLFLWCNITNSRNSLKLDSDNLM